MHPARWRIGTPAAGVLIGQRGEIIEAVENRYLM